MGQTPIPLVPGHRPPDPLPPAIDRLREAYVHGLPLETFEERVENLIRTRREDVREPLEWEAPPKPTNPRDWIAVESELQ